MAIQQFNDSILILAGKPIDDKFGPYVSIAAANTAIPQARRHAGLIFGIYLTPSDIPNSDVEYYYYYGDFTDSEYEKLIRLTLQQVTDNGGNATTNRIIHPDAINNNESATLGQVLSLISGIGGGIAGDYVPYTGATKNVNLGSNSLNLDSLTFNLNSTQTQSKGRLVWNETNGSLSLGLNANVISNIGLDDYIIGRNETGSIIPKGRVVRIVGSSPTNEKLLINLSDGTINANPNLVLGIAAENINNASNGYVTTRGKVRGINTTGATSGQTWAVNDYLYVSSNGGLTNIKPIAPNLKVPIAIVIKVDGTNGILEVRQINISNLGDLNNINLVNQLNKDILTYNSSTITWENRTLAYILGGTASQFVKGNGTLDSTTYQPLITGGATTITSNNLPIDRVLISNPDGKVAVSPITSNDLLSLSGITGNIQEQIDDINNRPITSEVIIKEGFVYIDSNSFTLTQTPDSIFSVKINGQYIPEYYYSFTNSIITFIDITFETEPEPDQIWIYYFKEMI